MGATRQTADRFGQEIESPLARFALMREDDKGVRFQVQCFSRRCEAEWKMRQLARGEHKQHYWIDEVSG